MADDNEIRAGIDEARRTLEPLVITANQDVHRGVKRARYTLELVKRMLEENKPWSHYRRHLDNPKETTL